jgi:uncharacterized protein (TIGR03435 family)
MAIVALGAVAAHVAAQESSPENLKFEVASVRPNTSGSSSISIQNQPGGRYTATNVPLRLLIRNAYRIQDSQLSGAPDWVASERFDIVAKADGPMSPPMPGGGPSRTQLMLRSLLEERFKLAVRWETREAPIYALTLARPDGKLGPQIRPSTVDCQALAAARRAGGPPAPGPSVGRGAAPAPGERPACGARMGLGEVSAGSQPISQLVTMLSQWVQRNVIDRTGLQGFFDFDLKWTPDQLPQGPPPPGVPIPSVDPDGPSIFTALQEQLGLKLESARGPVETLVIDHVERPTPD